MEIPITLSSNFDFDDNTIGMFKVKLPRSLNLNSNWGFCLKEISYTRSWYNVRQPWAIALWDKEGLPYSNAFKIDAGYYPTVEELVNRINKGIQATAQMEKKPKMEYDERSNKCRIIAGEMEGRKVFPLLGEELEQLLGFSEDISKYQYWTGETPDISVHVVPKANDKAFEKGVLKAVRPVELSAGYHSLYVYCDIIEPSIVGNAYTQLLKVVEVPENRRYNEQCVITYPNPQFHKLICNDIDVIQISIRDDTGQLVPFKSGRTIIMGEFQEVFKKNL